MADTGPVLSDRTLKAEGAEAARTASAGAPPQPDGIAVPDIAGFTNSPRQPPESLVQNLGNPALKVISLRRAQQTHGNRYVQRMVSQYFQRPAPDHAAIPSESAGETLDTTTRASMESSFQADFGDVRIHTDARAASSAERLDANAYTTGRDVYFAPGMYSPGSRDGKRLLAHELTHTLQQANGAMLQASAPAGSVRIGAANDPLEYEAERVAEQAAAGDRVDMAISGDRSTAVQARGGVPAVQRDPKSSGEELPPGSDQLELPTYRINIRGQQYSLTPTQYDMFLKATAREIARKAKSYQDTAQNLLETQQGHVNDSNTVVRHIADWFGDADLPDEEVYTQVQNEASGLIADVQHLTINPETGQRIQDLYNRLTLLALGAKAAERAWYKYINGTIEGAEVTVHRLEVVRDTAFAVDAALAGGLAAPAIFTAAGGGVVGTGLALGGGALAGSGTKGALETTSAMGGQLLSMAITPGEQSFDWNYVKQRGTSGVKSGAFDGLIGAGASFATPFVSGAVTRGVTQVGGEAFATSTAGRYTITGLTGVTMGSGTGAMGSATTNAYSLATGEMSTGEYFSRMGKGAFWGGVAGGAFSFVPVQGLNRESGIPFVGEPAPMPRWMFAGPGSPLPPRWEPPTGTWENAPRGSGAWNPPPGFNQLPLEQLPKLPSGMAWTRVTYKGQAQWEPMSTFGPSGEPVELTWYDNPAVSSANYTLRVGGRTIYGSQTFSPTAYTGLPANTGAGGTPLPGAPASTRRSFPMSPQDYTEPLTGQGYTRGHIIDSRNTTPRTATIPDSNMDPANYTAEQPWWGGRGGQTFGVRAQITNRIVRANPGGGVGLAQYNVSTSGRVTLNGEPIPDFYILVERDAAGVPTRAWQVPNTSATLPTVPTPLGGPSGPPVSTAAHADAAFGIPRDAIPQPILDHLQVEALAGAAAGEAVGSQE